MSTSSPRRVVLVGGYTAGHVFPAIATSEWLLSRGHEVVLVGAARGIEARLAAAHSLRFRSVVSAPFADRPLGGRVLALATALRGGLAARTLLRELAPHVVIGFGGFVTVGPLMAARSLGIPLAVHEANAIPGFANRFLSPLADRVLVGVPEAVAAFPRAQHVGLPVRAAVVSLQGRPRALSSGRPFRLLVTGGSLGADTIDAAAPVLVAQVRGRLGPIEVRHQSTSPSVGAVQRAYRAAGVPAEVTAFRPAIAEDYAWADVALCRAGALTIAELAIAGLPAVLVPLPRIGDHQACNAEPLRRLGLPVLSDGSLERDGASALATLLGDPAAHARAVVALRSLAYPDAAERVASALLDLART